MIADLARLRQEPPFSIDVTARVKAEVRRMGPPRRVPVASRRMALWSSVAGVAAAATLAALVLPGAPGWFGQFTGLATWAVTSAASMLGKLPGAVVSAVVWLTDFLTAFRGLAGALAPALAGALAAALAGMVGITGYVVGRDLRRGRPEGLEAR
jgi:hypothetical protein